MRCTNIAVVCCAWAEGSADTVTWGPWYSERERRTDMHMECMGRCHAQQQQQDKQLLFVNAFSVLLDCWCPGVWCAALPEGELLIGVVVHVVLA